MLREDDLTLIRDESDWQRFAVKTLEAFPNRGWTLSLFREPETYPCLAAATSGELRQLVVCLMYPEDANRLIRQVFTMDGAPEAVLNGEAPDIDDLIASVAESEQPGAEEGCPFAKKVTEQEMESHRRINAFLLSLLSELIAVGATSEDRFEKTYATWLSKVDQWTSGTAAGPAGMLDQLKSI